MKKIFLFACLGLPVFSAFAAQAQYRAAFPPSAEKEEWVDPAAKPIPKVFSSEVTSVKEAQKIDALYQNLYLSLWNYAITDLIYQRKLMEHLRAERFQLTRYPAEFKDDLSAAMNNLNQNYKRMTADIAAANEEYKDILEGIRSMDYPVLDPLWEEKIHAFKEKSMTYFQMQNKFLQTYKSLVSFILEQGGGYYYKSGTGNVHFYKNGALRFFVNSIDALKMTTYKQKEFLKSNAPVNADPSDLN